MNTVFRLIILFFILGRKYKDSDLSDAVIEHKYRVAKISIICLLLLSAVFSSIPITKEWFKDSDGLIHNTEFLMFLALCFSLILVPSVILIFRSEKKSAPKK